MQVKYYFFNIKFELKARLFNHKYKKYLYFWPNLKKKVSPNISIRFVFLTLVLTFSLFVFESSLSYSSLRRLHDSALSSLGYKHSTMVAYHYTSSTASVGTSPPYLPNLLCFFILVQNILISKQILFVVVEPNVLLSIFLFMKMEYVIWMYSPRVWRFSLL